jgi:putative tryptophan/tyrosine transport system substrate-binding protein
MRRREFIVVGGAMLAQPFAALAQQPEPVRRIAVLQDYAADDLEGQAQLAAFREALRKLGWTENKNMHIDYRAAAVDADQVRAYAAELAAMHPDVVLAAGGTLVAAVQRASQSVPIVFVNATDPVGSGLVASLSRPGGNATGFTQFEFGISAKWLELLKELAPGILRVAVIRDPTARGGGGQLGAIQAVAPSLRVELSPIDPIDPETIERGLAAFSGEKQGGLIVTTSRLARVHRDLIISLANRHRLPAIYPFRVYPADGGLISYGPSSIEPYRRAAGYVDRIFKGEKPAEMPVQAPTRYELVVNLKAAKQIGLTVPPATLARADEVIE